MSIKNNIAEQLRIFQQKPQDGFEAGGSYSLVYPFSDLRLKTSIAVNDIDVSLSLSGLDSICKSLLERSKNACPPGVNRTQVLGAKQLPHKRGQNMSQRAQSNEGNSRFPSWQGETETKGNSPSTFQKSNHPEVLPKMQSQNNSFERIKQGHSILNPGSARFVQDVSVKPPEVIPAYTSVAPVVVEDDDDDDAIFMQALEEVERSRRHQQNVPPPSNTNTFSTPSGKNSVHRPNLRNSIISVPGSDTSSDSIISIPGTDSSHRSVYSINTNDSHRSNSFVTTPAAAYSKDQSENRNPQDALSRKQEQLQEELIQVNAQFIRCLTQGGETPVHLSKRRSQLEQELAALSRRLNSPQQNSPGSFISSEKTRDGGPYISTPITSHSGGFHGPSTNTNDWNKGVSSNFAVSLAKPSGPIGIDRKQM